MEIETCKIENFPMRNFEVRCSQTPVDSVRGRIYVIESIRLMLKALNIMNKCKWWVISSEVRKCAIRRKNVPEKVGCGATDSCGRVYAGGGNITERHMITHPFWFQIKQFIGITRYRMLHRKTTLAK